MALPAIPLWGKIVAGAAGLLALRSVSARRAPSRPPAPSPPAPTIRLGSAGPAVAYWRWVVGVPAGTSFDAETAAATRAWQAARGLQADSVVGPATWAAAGIGSAPSPSPQPQPPPPAQPTPAPAPPPAPSPGNVFGLAQGIPQREAQILQIVQAGKVDHEWVPLTWQQGGRQVRVLVSRRALALRDGPSRLVVSATFPTAQAIGDLVGGSMLTTRMADEIWRQAPVRLAPITRPWSQDGTMARTHRMSEQSAAIDAAVGDAPGLVANEGKDWVVTRRNWVAPAGTGAEKPAGQSGSRHNGANFGWYAPSLSKSPGGEPVIQSVGLAHGMGHTDYSQLLRFVKTDSLTIDGQSVPLAAALADPAISPLLQDEGGTLPRPRHPDL